MNALKKILIIFGILIAICAGIYFWFTQLRQEINTSVQPMITKIVASNWDQEVINQYSTEAFKASTEKNSTYDRALNTLRALGPIQSYKGVQGFSYNKKSGRETAKANVFVDFQKMPVLFMVFLVKVEDQWKLDSFQFKFIDIK